MFLPLVIRKSCDYPIILILEIVRHRYFAWDYRVLKRFARHYSSGEIIPESLVSSMNAAKHMFVATEMQRQVNSPLWYLLGMHDS